MFNPTNTLSRNGFLIERFDGLAGQTQDQRDQMVQLFEAIWRELYRGQPEHSFEEIASSFFRDDQLIYLVQRDGEHVGFWVRRHCQVGSYRVINPRICGILPRFQKYGLYSMIHALDLEYDWAVEPERPRILFNRTRNPILWFENANQCSRIGIDLKSGNRDEELIELGAALANVLYPEYSYHRETMTCANVLLSHGKHVFYRDTPHHRDPVLDKAFYAMPAMANSLDSPCFIGLLIPPGEPGSYIGSNASAIPT